METQRHIVRRPRLTSLLDENPARVKLLVAPAGYGKTTLAQQWLETPERRDVWYRGGPASADVAALAVGLSNAVADVVPEAGKRTRERLRATGHPEEDVDILAELFAEDIEAWPGDGWLAIDDYHFAMDSPASERFVDLLTQRTPLQLLITTRRRPSWATARRILYGEIQEIDHRALAMDDLEATQVLGTQTPDATHLIERARGWPAVLGIAALTPGFRIPAEDLPDELYEYFAEELYRGLTPELREGLHRLALVPSMQAEFARELLGARAAELIGGGSRIGAVSLAADELIVHPLLRTFLNQKLVREEMGRLKLLASELAELLAVRHDWDTAFYIVSTYSSPELLIPLTAEALPELLLEGRTQTLLRWLEYAAQNHLSDSILDFAEAEVAFRQGQYAKAEALASQAAVKTTDAAALARTLLRAGQAAVMDSREDRGLQHFQGALLASVTDLERLEAAVGICFAALELGMTEQATEALDEVKRIELDGIDVAVRKAVVQLVYSTRIGGVQSALEIGGAIVPLLSEVRDPLARTSFLNSYGHLLALGALYPEALIVVQREIAEADRYRLPFALPHAHLIQAVAYCGLRDFSKAAAEINQAEELSPANDIYVAMHAAALRARLALCRHDYDDAVRHSSRTWGRSASAPMLAEFLAYAALSQACLGNDARAKALSDQARSTHASSVETQTLAACAEAIAALRTGKPNARCVALDAYVLVEGTGGRDTLVTAFRAYPEFLRTIVDELGATPEVSALLARSNDFRLAQSVGLELVGVPVGPMSTLTRRETEIAHLVAEGRTNREIAEHLFISISTVKVHIRHILGKLNARTRSEIAARVSDT